VAYPGEINWLLPSRSHYEHLMTIVPPEMVAEKIVCGPDLERFVAKGKRCRGSGSIGS
jgi:hypothetical protein